MSKSTKTQSEFVVAMVRETGEQIVQLTDQGYDQAGLEKMCSTCAATKAIMDPLGWFLRDMTDEKREKLLDGLMKVVGYVREYKDPRARIEQECDELDRMRDILTRFNEYVNDESQYYRNPFDLTGFVSFIVQAAGTIAASIEEGYDRVATTSKEKLMKEWQGRPTKESDKLPRGVSTRPWFDSDVYRLADEAREKATADDKKPCAR